MNKRTLIGALAALLILPATSQAADTAFVTHDPVMGVQYSGTAGQDTVTFTTAGGKLVIDTSGPLTAFRDCQVVAGDATKATCPVPSVIDVSAGDGRDTVTNGTQISMRANGGAGTDKLTGGSARDELFGQSGDDVIVGRLGDDLLSGGAGARDSVAYSDRAVGVQVNLNGSTVNNGAAGERDTLLGDFESAGGGTGNDSLRGSAGDNELFGGLGQDTLVGLTGKDVLVGGDGGDTLIANNEFFRHDGAADILTAGNDLATDSCMSSTADFDQVKGCELAF